MGFWLIVVVNNLTKFIIKVILMKNLHIVMCSDLEQTNGGCEIWLSYFVPEIVDRKLYKEISVYHVNNENRSKYVKQNNVNYYSCSKRSNGILNVFRFSYFALWHLKRNENFEDDIILVGSTFVALVGIFHKLLSMKNPRICTWIRSIAVEELRLRSPYLAILSNFLEHVLLRFSHVIIMNGRDTYDYYTNKYDITSKSFIIENAVSNKNLFMLSKKFDSGKFNLAYMGRYVAAKGIDLYVESVKRFLMKYDFINFHAYGYGEFEGKLYDAGIIDHGRYTLEDVPNILQFVDGVVFFNRSGIAGGVSHSLLECMAAGKVIIAWNNKIHNQVCTSDSAFLMEENNLDELEKVYVHGLSNWRLLNQKSCRARQVAAMFSIEKHVDKFQRIMGLQ